MSTPDNEKPPEPINMRLLAFAIEGGVKMTWGGLHVASSVLNDKGEVIVKIVSLPSPDAFERQGGIIELEIGVNEWRQLKDAL